MFYFMVSPLLLLLLLLGVILGISGNNFIITWIGMELNTLMFMAFLSVSENSQKTCLKYFFIQSVSSSFFLGLLSLYSWSPSLELSMFLVFSLSLKSGVAPFHVWVINFMENLSWLSLGLIASIQKILPLYALSLIEFNYSSLIIMTCFFSVIGSIGQSSLKKILAYSSIFSGAWMLSMTSWFSIMMIFLGVYSLGLMGVMVWGVSSSTSFLSELRESMDLSLGGLSGFLSMAGFPPFLGFYLKLIIIKELMILKKMILLMMLVQSSIFILFMYLQMLTSIFFELKVQSSLSIVQMFSSLSPSILILLFFML